MGISGAEDGILTFSLKDALPLGHIRLGALRVRSRDNRMHGDMLVPWRGIRPGVHTAFGERGTHDRFFVHLLWCSMYPFAFHVGCHARSR